MAKQTRKKHAERRHNVERTMRAICELILELRPKEEEPRRAALKPAGQTL